MGFRGFVMSRAAGESSSPAEKAAAALAAHNNRRLILYLTYIWAGVIGAAFLHRILLLHAATLAK